MADTNLPFIASACCATCLADCDAGVKNIMYSGNAQRSARFFAACLIYRKIFGRFFVLSVEALNCIIAILDIAVIILIKIKR
jgi:hypothetical protein